MKDKIYRLDGKTFSSKNSLYDYIEGNYGEEIKRLGSGWDGARYWFFLRYGKVKGKSVISGKETPWNPVTERYERFADEAERQQYREEFKRRMISKYGKVDNADDPEHQKKMLANRSISQDYKWQDGSVTKVTGDYEAHFLHFLETVYGFKAEYLTEPPTFYYKDADQKTRFYLPDFYVPSLNLIIEIKGGNGHYQSRDEGLETLKANSVKEEGFNFVQINDKVYSPFNAFFLNAVGHSA
jgi:hypothetical protein